MVTAIETIGTIKGKHGLILDDSLPLGEKTRVRVIVFLDQNGDEDVDALLEFCRGLDVHVNLIPYNTVEGLPWKRPSLTRQERFADVLRAARVPVTLRREKGHDIAAACGQLRLQTEKQRTGAN